MAWTAKPKSKPKIVRKRLADGTIKEYRYDRYPAATAPLAEDTLGALIRAWQRSPEWSCLSPKRKAVYTHYIKPLARVGHIKADQLPRKGIRDMRDAIASQGRPGAANGFVAAVSAMCTWATKADWLPFNPAKGITPIPSGHLPAWSQADADRAIAELPPYLGRLCLLALHTGQRRADLTRMTWADYDGARIRVRQSKTGTALVIPVHPTLKAALDTWPREADTILVNRHGKQFDPQAMSKNLMHALTAIGFPAVGSGIHGLRKLAATRLAEAGCSALEIAAITGHRSLAMVSLYTRAADQETMATAAMRRLQRNQNGNRLETAN